MKPTGLTTITNMDEHYLQSCVVTSYLNIKII